MRRWLPLALFFCAVLLAARPVRAQDAAPLPSTAVRLPIPPAPLTDAQRSELDTWLDGMRKWQRTDKRYHNEPAHTAFGGIANRTPRPDPPPWLEAQCAPFPQHMLTTLPAPLGPACRLLAGLEEDPAAAAMQASTAAARASAEKVQKSTFLTRVHIDGPWTSMSTDVQMYGVFGSHISLVDVGRVQFFGPPGVIMLLVPDGRG